MEYVLRVLQKCVKRLNITKKQGNGSPEELPTVPKEYVANHRSSIAAALRAGKTLQKMEGSEVWKVIS
jgi:hypothetical protein